MNKIKKFSRNIAKKDKKNPIVIKRYEIIISSIFILLTIALIKLKLPAYFFDVFGFITFSFLFYVGYLIRNGRKVAKSLGFILLLIAVLGLLVDGAIVIQSYLLK